LAVMGDNTTTSSGETAGADTVVVVCQALNVTSPPERERPIAT